jgi:nanoRNase/pAp phosphatase (c-di-AMP/oligoRNAs hydrolase)
MSGSLLEFCENARARFDAAEKILLVSHIFPDADSIGSEAALARHLTQMGKQVRVCNPTPVQETYNFLIDLSGLPGAAWTSGADNIPDHDLAVILDVSDWDYMGKLGEVLQVSPVKKLIFDHHQAAVSVQDVGMIDLDASATGEVLYRYFLATGAEVDAEMAAALYAAILFDTGGFRFRNTKDETLLIAAELIRRGASHQETATHLFENESFSRVELLTAALSHVVSEEDGLLAWTYVTEDMFRITGTSSRDADGIIDQLMTIRGVELAVLFRDTKDNGIRVTFRSKGSHDVSALAEKLGGGGRPTASGVTLKGAPKKLMADVLTQARTALHCVPPGSLEQANE